MSDHHTLSEAFLQSLPAGAPVSSSAELEDALSSCCATGRATWISLQLPDTDFVRYLAASVLKGAGGGELPAQLSELCIADLYLCCGCVQGVPAAIVEIERSVLSHVPAMLAGMPLSSAQAEDVQQAVRSKLLMGVPGKAPALAEYGGRGALQSWVRVIAVRTALDLLRKKDEQPSNRDQDIVDRMMAPEADPELKYLKDRYRKEFRDALYEAVGSLSTEQRNLLRMYFLAGLKTAQIGKMLQVNQSTIVRWLSSAREAIQSETRRLLRERLRLSASEFDSLTLLVQSQLEISLSQLLGEQPAGSPGSTQGTPGNAPPGHPGS